MLPDNLRVYSAILLTITSAEKHVARPKSQNSPPMRCQVSLTAPPGPCKLTASTLIEELELRDRIDDLIVKPFSSSAAWYDWCFWQRGDVINTHVATVAITGLLGQEEPTALRFRVHRVQRNPTAARLRPGPAAAAKHHVAADAAKRHVAASGMHHVT